MEAEWPDGERERTDRAQGSLLDDYLEPLTAKPSVDLEQMPGAVGRTMFDAPSAEDGSVTVLLPKEHIGSVPLQALVRIHSREDKRTYLGIVVSGPFAEPDGLRADANVIVTTSVRGGIFMPRYHGRVQVEILGEEISGTLVPPRFRPLPNSPVTLLTREEKAAALRCEGDMRLGSVIGDEELVVGIPSEVKSVLPRHTAILGTTGGGKSTTIGRLLAEAQRTNTAVVLLDTEGEYVHVHQPTDDDGLRAVLDQRGLTAEGIPRTQLYHLVGTETANPEHPDRTTFGLSFEAISPYTVAEILGLNEAQGDRFFQALGVAKQLLRDLGIFPRAGHPEDERRVLELNEFEEGYPALTLSRLIDVATAMRLWAEHGNLDQFNPYDGAFQQPKAKERFLRRVEEAKPRHAASWQATLSRIWRLHRYRIFDQQQSPALDRKAMKKLLTKGAVSIIDLSGTDSTELNNIVIADLLRRIQAEQDLAYQYWEEHPELEFRRVLVVIEEAHEFLSNERIAKMRMLYEQVARVSRRGRKRWLGLVFVTQLPNHLPREVLGLVNNYVLHKINDETVIRTLRGVIPGIDESQWRRLPALAPGQAIVSFTHMTRPLLIAVDPSGCRLRMVD